MTNKGATNQITATDDRQRKILPALHIYQHLSIPLNGTGDIRQVVIQPDILRVTTNIHLDRTTPLTEPKIFLYQ